MYPKAHAANSAAVPSRRTRRAALSIRSHGVPLPCQCGEVGATSRPISTAQRKTSTTYAMMRTASRARLHVGAPV